MVMVAMAMAVVHSMSKGDSKTSKGERKLTEHERAEHEALAQFRERRVQHVAVLAHAQPVLDAQSHEDGQRRHLRGQTGDHNVDAGLVEVRLVAIRGRGNGAARGLQDQREQIAAHEDYGVGLRLDARDGGRVGDDQAAQADVDGGAEEGRADGEADQLPGV